MSRIFISYSHDSSAHKTFVRGIADQLRSDGLDCRLDQYINGFPAEGWQRWMEDQVEQADFVLLVCTPDYLERYRGKARDGGRGVNFEGVVISQTLYDAYYRNTKFIPVLPENGQFDDVPLPLKGFSAYTLPADYDGLYRLLTDQAATPAPAIGEKRVLAEISPSPPAPLPQGDRGVNADVSQGVGRVSDTVKAAYIAGGFALLAALIAGVFTLFAASGDITVTGSECAQVNTGANNGTTTQHCAEEKP